MKALRLKIISNTQKVLDDTIAEIPLITDPRVWSDQYIEPVQHIHEDTGNQVLTAMMYFPLESDRDDVAEAIQGVHGFFVDCEVGTEILYFDTWHDGDGNADKPCEQKVIYEVVA